MLVSAELLYAEAGSLSVFFKNAAIKEKELGEEQRKKISQIIKYKQAIDKTYCMLVPRCAATRLIDTHEKVKIISALTKQLSPIMSPQYQRKKDFKTALPHAVARAFYTTPRFVRPVRHQVNAANAGHHGLLESPNSQ